jgi:hypothetical protein
MKVVYVMIMVWEMNGVTTGQPTRVHADRASCLEDAWQRNRSEVNRAQRVRAECQEVEYWDRGMAGLARRDVSKER